MRLIAACIAVAIMLTGQVTRASADAAAQRAAFEASMFVPVVNEKGALIAERYEGVGWILWQVNRFEVLEFYASLLRDPDRDSTRKMSGLRRFYESTWEIISPNYEHLDLVDKDWRVKYKYWTTNKPASPTPHMFHAYYLFRKAWSFRGEGYASSVSRRDFKVFSDSMAEAKQILEACAEICKNDPEFYSLLIEIEGATGSHKSTIVNLAKEGIALHPNFKNIYGSTATFLHPLWGGSFESIAALAEYAEKTSGEGMYDYTFTGARGLGFPDYLRRNPAVWSRIKLSAEQLIRRGKPLLNPVGYLHMACDAMDEDVVIQMIGILNYGKLDPSEYCRWPVASKSTAGKGDPVEITPDELRQRREQPKKTAATPPVNAPTAKPQRDR